MNAPSCQRAVPWNHPPVPSAGIVMPHAKRRDAATVFGSLGSLASRTRYGPHGQPPQRGGGTPC
jgi:hypothetical protein